MPLSHHARDHRWVTVWAAMPQLTDDVDDMPPAPFYQKDVVFQNTTLRQTLRVTTGGSKLRIRISNTFGRTDLSITAVTVAIPKPSSDGYMAGSKIVHAGTVQTVTFGGEPDVDIPPRALMVSDAISLPVESGQVISVTMYLSQGQSGDITSHPGSRTESWMCYGNHVAAEDLTDSSLHSIFRWFFICGVEAWQPKAESHGCMVVLGDSLTDGRASTNNGNDRWSDLLFNRMLTDPFARNIAVINQAAGGNRITADGKGPSLLSRLDRDLISQAGVSYVLVFEGINDIGKADSDSETQASIYKRLIQAYRQITARAHAVGLPVFASTLGPFGGEDPTKNPYASTSREETRQKINEWIRRRSEFDFVIDLDEVLRDPDNPSCLRADYDSGDSIHPNVQGFHAMANAFPLEIFSRFTSL